MWSLVLLGIALTAMQGVTIYRLMRDRDKWIEVAEQQVELLKEISESRDRWRSMCRALDKSAHTIEEVA